MSRENVKGFGQSPDTAEPRLGPSLLQGGGAVPGTSNGVAATSKAYWEPSGSLIHADLCPLMK